MKAKHEAAAVREAMAVSSWGRGPGSRPIKRTAALFFALLCLTVGAGATPPLPAIGTVEVVFTPWDDAEGAIVRALDEAKKSLHVQAYVLTSRSIAQALQSAQSRGVAVEILADRDMMERSDTSLLPRLAGGGIPVWLETRYAAAHNKVILIDVGQPDAAVITGSYNFSWSAQARNAENLLILRGNPALVQRYLDNWLRHRSEAEKMSKAK
jgi:phosphatidylserine/phosphatidylglycerophosphate/cardiolipin synthase-like enzyme